MSTKICSTIGYPAGTPEKKANHPRASTRPLRLIVSIHARHCCRANHAGAVRDGGRCLVSIHARHCCRANPGRLVPSSRGTKFQSTPGIAAGRIDAFAARLACPRRFNPRPALLPGESPLLSGIDQSDGVSIHARHCCRANLPRLHPVRAPYKVSIHARHCCRANPSAFGPARSSGRVSIHARHCCRANRQLRADNGMKFIVSIHARHCCRANRLMR